MQAVLPMVKSLSPIGSSCRSTPKRGNYALVIAREDKKLGPDIKPSTSDCSNAQAENQERPEALAKGGPAALASMLPRAGGTTRCSIGPAAMGAGAFGMRANGQAIRILNSTATRDHSRILIRVSRREGQG